MVQDAVTYSYVWLADQMGHVCLGIVINFILTDLLKWLLGGARARMVLGQDRCLADWYGDRRVSREFCAFRSAVKSATGLSFTLDRKLLRDNAIIAAAYMVCRAWPLVTLFQLPEYGLRAFLVLVLLGILPRGVPGCARRSSGKKAALPYLFRLSPMPSAPSTSRTSRRAAEADQRRGTTRGNRPRQVVIGGPIGSPGRSGNRREGIGTEFAFGEAMVRAYMSPGRIARIRRAAAQAALRRRPWPCKNIGYWRWSEAQVIIIDDIGPLIAAPGITRAR